MDAWWKRLHPLTLHGAVIIDDLCEYAAEIRNELLTFAAWREMTQLVSDVDGLVRRRIEYVNQSGITTGPLEGRCAEGLSACYRLAHDLERDMSRMIDAVGARHDGRLRLEFNGMAYGEGGRLLPHTDHGVHRDRRVAWILYLTEPDAQWTATDGGALFLHDPPLVETVYPRFNRFLAFRVDERSVHEIGEVRRPTPWDRCRLTLSGWISGGPPR
jgi:hypothetical protein